jgi:hypothetical protein
MKRTKGILNFKLPDKLAYDGKKTNRYLIDEIHFEPIGLVSPELYNHIEKLLKENPDIPWKIS